MKTLSKVFKSRRHSTVSYSKCFYRKKIWKYWKSPVLKSDCFNDGHITLKTWRSKLNIEVFSKKITNNETHMMNMRHRQVHTKLKHKTQFVGEKRKKFIASDFPRVKLEKCWFNIRNQMLEKSCVAMLVSGGLLLR